MVKYCCICKIKQRMIPDISFHKISNNPELKAKWVINIGRELNNYNSVCSRHFKEKDFSYKVYGENIKRFLISTAVPSCLIQCKKSLQVTIETQKSINQKPDSPLNSTNNSESEQILANITNTHSNNISNIDSNSIFTEYDDCAQASISHDNEKADISVTEQNVSRIISDDSNISLDLHCADYIQEEVQH
ncbi:uncharacterized protein [Anoplolepis gracilipes]|uniref:uncharacterized protein n=1 Tax=Anoplolepis gracilipes TaxID=354296 RepID=UPI003BA138C0